MHCSDEELIAHLDGELGRFKKMRVRRHLDACWTCRARVAASENQIHSLSQAVDEWAFPGPFWSIDAKMQLGAGMREVEETLRDQPVPSRGFRLLRLAWVGASVLALTAAIWMLQTKPAEDRSAVAETIARALGTEKELYRSPLQQEFIVQVAEIRPMRNARVSKLQIWSDGAGGRFASRWSTPDGQLKHALWKPSAGAEYVYAPAVSTAAVRQPAHMPQGDSISSLSNGSLDVTQMEAAFSQWLDSRAWHPISFASDLSVWSQQDGTVLRAERLAEPDGSTLVRITAQRTTNRLTAELSVDLDAADYRPRLQTIRFETPERTVEFRLAVTSIRAVGVTQIPPAIFAPDASLLPSASAGSTNRSSLNIGSGSSIPPAATNGSLLDDMRMIEAQYVLHRAGACLGEAVEIFQEPDGVRVRSRDALSSRRPETLAAFAGLQDVLAALAELRNRAEIPAETPVLNRSSRSSSALLQNAAALRQLADVFTPGRTLTWTARPWRLLESMIRDHAVNLRQELESLNVRTGSKSRSAYTVRGWRESASTLFDKVMLADELMGEDQAADAAGLIDEIEVELASIISNLAAKASRP